MSVGYKELEVWQIGRRLVKEVYGVSATFPEDERFGITAQPRRAAVSIPTNIADGHGRKLEKAFGQFVRIALGSVNELETLLILSCDLEFIAEQEAQPLFSQHRRLAVKLQNLLTRLAREDHAEYGTALQEEQLDDRMTTT
jgi:four helix bundle protein